MKQLKDQLKAQQTTAQVEVECQLADASQQLLLEVTALRTKMAELQSNSASTERELRASIRHEYNALVHGLFSMVFELNHQLDENRSTVGIVLGFCCNNFFSPGGKMSEFSYRVVLQVNLNVN